LDRRDLTADEVFGETDTTIVILSSRRVDRASWLGSGLTGASSMATMAAQRR
jgi:hypothetical protein